MGLNTNGLFTMATQHMEEIKRELKTQTEFLRTISSTDVEEETQTFRWLKSSGTTDGNGNLTMVLENRTGFALELVSWSAVATATSNGGILFYLANAEPQNLIWSAVMTQYNSDKFTSGMIVPVNGTVVAQFAAVQATSLAFANILARRAQVGKTQPYKAKLPGW